MINDYIILQSHLVYLKTKHFCTIFFYTHAQFKNEK